MISLIPSFRCLHGNSFRTGFIQTPRFTKSPTLFDRCLTIFTISKTVALPHLPLPANQHFLFCTSNDCPSRRRSPCAQLIASFLSAFYSSSLKHLLLYRQCLLNHEMSSLHEIDCVSAHEKSFLKALRMDECLKDELWRLPDKSSHAALLMNHRIHPNTSPCNFQMQQTLTIISKSFILCRTSCKLLTSSPTQMSSSASSRSSTPTPGPKNPVQLAKKILKDNRFLVVAVAVAVLTCSVILSRRLPDAANWKLTFEGYSRLYVRSIDVVVALGAILSVAFLVARYAIDFAESV